jgi:hypothetical protein
MNTTYIISYDVAKGGQYEPLINAIKAYGTWAHITESTWAVVTSKEATQIRDNLIKFLPEGSRLIVVKSGTEAAWGDVLCSNDWLKKNL